MNELEAIVLLASIPGLGAIKIRLLLQHFGSALEALKASAAQVNTLSGFDKITPYWDLWRKDTSWQQDLALAEKRGARLIPFTSQHYPKSLLEIPDHPVLLYVLGELKPQDSQSSIAIVGTRQSSIYGSEMAEAIGKDLAAQGFTVISGLARGIDTCAHRGALQSGRTVAVIGSGLDRIYPTENLSLAKSISSQGALISEFPMSTPPDRQNFPQRNRIVSGMTLGTLLIEAPIKSGAMITMDKAYQYKRKLFALPGRVDSGSFQGNHLLIKSGKAHLIENARDIIAHFEELSFIEKPRSIGHQNPQLDAEEHAFLAKMPNEEMTIDALANMALLPVHQVHRILMGLVLKKVIKEFPGKIYKKLASEKRGNSS